MTTYPELTGKSVLVTGAGRGIGLAIARRFITEGAQVLLTDIDAGESGKGKHSFLDRDMLAHDTAIEIEVYEFLTGHANWLPQFA